MLEMAEKALSKIRGKTKKNFDADENLRLALIYLLQVIGEAASKISPEFRNKHPFIPWKEVIGMRNKLVHNYLSVDENIVWKTVTEELEPLIDKLKAIIPPQDKT